jgi:putative cell division protein ftsI
VDINVVKEQFNKGIMPDLKNLSLREFLDVFPREKYPNLKINGSGAVVDQFPKAETKINRNTTINVAFK